MYFLRNVSLHAEGCHKTSRFYIGEIGTIFVVFTQFRLGEAPLSGNRSIGVKTDFNISGLFLLDSPPGDKHFVSSLSSPVRPYRLPNLTTTIRDPRACACIE